MEVLWSLIPFWKIYFRFILFLEEAKTADYIPDFLSMTLPYNQQWSMLDISLLNGDNAD